MIPPSHKPAAPSVDRVLQGRRALWQLADPLPPEIRQELQGSSVMLAHLLYCRGYRTAGEIDGYFTGVRISHDPFLLPDMDRAVHRIAQAVERQERVAVYGDFDCDGIAAAAILVDTLRGLGLDPISHIPTRSDGHGLQTESLALLADREVSLIITADCGVSALSEVQVARGMGMDVIITDHHEPKADGSLPNCPTVAPTRHHAQYPCRFLCGAGVVYKLAQALGQSVPGAPDPAHVLDLVALGTVADVVPLKDENRSLVIQGLERLRRTRRPGLLALFRAASIEPEQIDPVSVGFYLAPRINAANRMATPQLAYDLITATDPAVADELAARLTAFNQERQDLVAQQFALLTEQLGSPLAIAEDVMGGRRAPVLVAVGDWPAGISGLLAAKLVEAYGLPAFLGSDTGGEVVAVSARGVAGVHIDEILEGCETALPGGLFLGYGGHSTAGGFRVERARLDSALALLEREVADQVRLDHVGAVLSIDAEVSLASLSLRAAQQVRTLAPFGNGFPEPLFLARGVTLQRRSPVGGGRHARFTLRKGSGWLDGVYFGVEPEFMELPLNSRIDTVFHLQVNEWNGTVKQEARLRDWRPAA